MLFCQVSHSLLLSVVYCSDVRRIAEALAINRSNAAILAPRRIEDPILGSLENSGRHTSKRGGYLLLSCYCSRAISVARKRAWTLTF